MSPDEVLDLLRAAADPATLAGMPRYGLPTEHALGVPMRELLKLGKQIGRRQDLALGLWKTGVYEARLLCSFVADPEQLTAAQMDRWCKDFHNWGVVDTLCFHCFDRTPLAWARVDAWAQREDEFGKRAAYALLACLALHGRVGRENELFLSRLPLVEQGAQDERNFVKKGVAWALVGIGQRNAVLKAAALELARKLAESSEPGPRFVGKDAIRKLK